MFHVISSAIVGVCAIPITVETDISFGMRAFSIVGLPDTSVKESRDRIRAAIKNSGFTFPRGRVTVNLAPADIRKQGPVYDLPIAVSILVASGEISRSVLKDSVFVGELSLDGSVRAVSGVLTTALMAKNNQKTVMFVPEDNTQEALCVGNMTVYAVKSLTALIDHCKEIDLLKPATETQTQHDYKYPINLFDIRGQELAKRGLEIAAGGGHNVLLNGPPGTGKTLLAKSVPSILPELSTEEAIEVTSIVSIAGELMPHQGLVSQRPFRNPHHSASAVALVGGGTWPKPGEVSLSHRGVLFLDELPEFSRHVLEHLRQPLEDGSVTISRATGSSRFPARFLLIAAMNPCPCGYLTDPKKMCECTHTQVSRYQKRLSGPLLDRFDLVIEVPNLQTKDLTDLPTGESSETVRERIKLARAKQTQRLGCSMTNSEIPPGKISELCKMSDDAKSLLQTAFSQQYLSARAYFKIQKVARTIADLDDSELVKTHHIAEALQFRAGKKD